LEIVADADDASPDRNADEALASLNRAREKSGLSS
jgi:hypothetical protein